MNQSKNTLTHYIGDTTQAKPRGVHCTPEELDQIKMYLKWIRAQDFITKCTPNGESELYSPG